MEPNRQMEIQLGHMCNNRCVFCVSGQRTAMREALPLSADPIVQSIREQHAAGMRKLTILGGEPTIQPEFMNIMKEAVGLGFEEIVLFTNGVKTARLSFLDEILALGGNFTFRFSFQGANREAHERTTKKDGSFQRLVDSLGNARLRGQRITVNMCVVQSNYASVADFPALLLPYGASQLHLDMVRPLDAGVRTEAEFREMIPHYPSMVPHLERMISGFPEGFDVNIGNFPYCLAPQLARWIHHDGQQTMTITIDDKDAVSKPFDKYVTKRRDKLKKESCRSCVFDDQCSGVFEMYRDFYGMAELEPVTPERLLQVDPERKLFTVHLKPYLKALEGWSPPPPFARPDVVVNQFDNEARLHFAGPNGPMVVALRPPGSGFASTNRLSLHLYECPDAGAHTRGLLRALFETLTETGGDEVLHPPGDDAPFLGDRPPRLGSLFDPRLGYWMRLLRARAPFGGLRWESVAVGALGKEAVLGFVDAAGTPVRVTLTMKPQGPSAAYQLADPSKASPGMVEGLKALFGVLRAPQGSTERPAQAST